MHLESSGGIVERRFRTVLWIDDQVEPGDPSVRVLALEGFHVDCAASGEAGLTMASGGAYHAIILDLHLPDTSGLTLLEHLRASGVSTPVLVLTGYGDLDSAVAALRLGVADFRRKPLIADELVAAVRGVADAGVGSTVAAVSPDEAAPPDDRESRAVRHLQARLDEIADSTEGGRTTTEQLTAALMLAVESSAFGISAFVVCAEALRHVLVVIEPSAPQALLAQVRHQIARTDTPPAIDHRRVRTVLAQIEADVTRGVRPNEYDLAKDLGVDPAHLGRLIRSQTGRGFRLWRSAFAIRLAVRMLADRETQIAEVGFKVGYEHPSQFDREFRRLLGVSPRGYRRLRHTLLRYLT